jgi:hypothetical protein
VCGTLYSRCYLSVNCGCTFEKLPLSLSLFENGVVEKVIIVSFVVFKLTKKEAGDTCYDILQ